MVATVRDENEIADFARSVGDWLLTQSFRSIKPVTYRWYPFDPAP